MLYWIVGHFLALNRLVPGIRPNRDHLLPAKFLCLRLVGYELSIPVVAFPQPLRS